MDLVNKEKIHVYSSNHWQQGALAAGEDAFPDVEKGTVVVL